MMMGCTLGNFWCRAPKRTSALAFFPCDLLRERHASAPTSLHQPLACHCDRTTPLTYLNLHTLQSSWAVAEDACPASTFEPAVDGRDGALQCAALHWTAATNSIHEGIMAANSILLTDTWAGGVILVCSFTQEPIERRGIRMGGLTKHRISYPERHRDLRSLAKQTTTTRRRGPQCSFQYFPPHKSPDRLLVASNSDRVLCYALGY